MTEQRITARVDSAVQETQRDNWMPRSTVVIVSPHFPPSTLAGVHRTRHLAKHLPAHGWRPVVIRVHERHYPELPDQILADLVPDSVEQVRTGAIPASIARVAGIGDIGLRAFRHLGVAAVTVAKREGASAILITGSPFYPMLMANELHRRLGIPVILDFQDPWASAQGASRPYFSKGRMAHRLAVALEPKALRGASWITSVSEAQNREMAARYPWIDPTRMSAIPIGGDPDDFTALPVNALNVRSVTLPSDRINLCYVGTFLPRAGPIVRTVFEAIATLKRDAPELASKLRLTFVGTSNQPPGTASSTANHRVTPIAAEVGIGDLVHEHPPRVPFVEALELIRHADGLLLLGSDEPHYTASKIYPALMSGSPYLSVFHRSSSSHQILSTAGGGAAVGFENLEELASLVETIAVATRRLVERPQSYGRANPATYADYTASAVAGKFAAVFRRAMV